MRIFKMTMVAISAALISQSAFSQTKREIEIEDPKQAPNFRIDITPLNFNVSNFNVYDNVEYGLRGVYRIKNRVTLSAEYRGEIIEAVSGRYSDEGAPSSKSGNTIDVSGTFYFSVKEKEFEQRLRLKQKAVGHNTIEVLVDDVPATKLAMYGARVGFTRISSLSALSDAFLVSTENPAVGMQSSVTPMQISGIAYVGLSATRIRNLKVKYPVYGTRRTQFVREYYLDFMYAANNSFGNVNFKDANENNVEYSVTSSYDISKVGARIGFFNTSVGKKVNLGWGMELGCIPRNISFSSGFYYNFRFAVPLAFNLNKSE